MGVDLGALALWGITPSSWGLGLPWLGGGGLGWWVAGVATGGWAGGRTVGRTGAD